MRLLLLQTIALVAVHQGCAQDVAPLDGPNPALCASPDGYFPDPIQCDKYYECVDGVPTEKICPDGQAFKDDNPKREVCEYLFNVKCGLRSELQIAQVSPNCPRANGYFAHPDPTNCREFFYCVQGEPAHNSCPAGLHFSKASGNCGWTFAAGRVGCAKEISPNGFECPVVTDRRKAVAHPRYPNPDDCKLFYVCFNAQGPARDSGCDLGLVFHTEVEACKPPSEVPGCENYYDGYFADYFANLFGAPADDAHLQIAAFLNQPIPDIARKNPDVKKFQTTTRRRVTQAPRVPAAPAQVSQASRRPVDDTPVEAVPHRFSTESSRPSRPAGAAGTRRRVRPGVTRRKKTTTSTTTTTTPKPTTVADPDYYYYEDGDYYYYDDNSTLPIEGGAAAAVEATTTTLPPSTISATRRTLSSSLSRNRPFVRPSRPEKAQPEA